MIGEYSDTELLEVRDLEIVVTKGPHQLKVLEAADLDVKPGEIVGLIGESGAGKSTLGLATMGYVRRGGQIVDGTVFFQGRDLLPLPEAERRKLRGARIAYVAQSAAASFNPAHRLMTQCIEVAVRYGGMPREEAQQRAIELFRLTKLPQPEQIGSRYPHQVSGGQLQRIMVVMAMLSQPDLIIFDEPTTALDVTTQVEVLITIKDLVRQFRTAAIYISHDMAVVAQMADRIIVLKDGRIVDQGPTQKMLTDVNVGSYTRQLLHSRKFHKARSEKTAATLVNVNGISASYASIQVIRDVSFRIAKGRVTAIIGESGSGKSTTARIIAGLKTPDKGTIEWEGVPLPKRAQERMLKTLQRIQYIHQHPDTALNPHHSVRKTLSRPAMRFCGLKSDELAQRVADLLRSVELEPERYLDRLPHQLSGGQKQRICIARALAADAQLLICDEVTSALDPVVANNILQLLARLQKELDLTLLLITHDIDVVRSIADDIVVMKGGRIEEQGSYEEVLLHPQSEYTDLLIRSAPELRVDWLDQWRT